MIVLAAPLLVLALELAVVGWPASSLRRLCRPGRSEIVDICLFLVFAAGATGTATLLCSLGLSALVERLCSAYLVRANQLGTSSSLLNCALYLLAMDGALYWLHRAQHSPLLWRFHKLHHDAERLNPLVLHRVNPADLTFNALPRAIALLLATPSPAALTIIGTVIGCHSLLIHTTLPWNFGRLGKWLLISPAAHQVHHSFDPAFYNRNFGSTFPLWDRFFGTWAEMPQVLNGVEQAFEQNTKVA